MNTESLINAISKDSALLKIEDKDFEHLIESFPYFQSARKLYLRKLKLEKNYRFNSELKKTAAFINDRNLLFDFVTEEEKQEEEVIDTVSETQSDIKEEVQTPLTEKTQEVDIPKKENKTEEPAANEVHQTLEFDKNDVHSFNEWLQLSNLKVIHRREDISKAKEEEKAVAKEDEQNDKKNKFDLIDKFINANPKLKPKPKGEGSNPNIALSSTEENEGWMTETLAQVYVEQKKYSKAIKAYKILGLKYPEKSGFFADRIRAIKKLSGS